MRPIVGSVQLVGVQTTPANRREASMMSLPARLNGLASGTNHSSSSFWSSGMLTNGLNGLWPSSAPSADVDGSPEYHEAVLAGVAVDDERRVGTADHRAARDRPALIVDRAWRCRPMMRSPPTCIVSSPVPARGAARVVADDDEPDRVRSAAR